MRFYCTFGAGRGLDGFGSAHHCRRSGCFPGVLVLCYRQHPREGIEAELAPRYGLGAVRAAYDRVTRWVEAEGAFFTNHRRLSQH